MQSPSRRSAMDAPQPAPTKTVTEVISVARLSTAVFSAIALLFSIGALIVASDHKTSNKTTTQGGVVSGASAVLTAANIPSGATPVTLSELKIEPNMIMVNKGGVLKVTNGGAIQHTLSVEGTDLVTPTLDPKAVAGLSLSSLAPGDYKVSCTIPGHKAAGMVADLMVTGDGATTAAGAGSSSGTKSADAMDAEMAGPTKAFPA